MENRVDSSYNSLQLRLEKRFTHGLTGNISYTLGEALSGAPDHISTSGGGAGIDTGVFREPQDGNNLRAEYGPSEFDVRHRFVASYIWELPFGRGRRWGNGWGRAMDLAFGGWQVTGIHVLQSGLALTATLAGANVVNLGGERRARPNLVGDPELPESERTLARWFNTDAFAAFAGAAGVRQRRRRDHARARTSPTSTSRSPRTSRSTDRRYFQFRTEVFNAFNHPNFGPPNIARDSSGFGQILSAAPARNHPVRREVLFLSARRIGRVLKEATV